jgi:RCC1 and BTB domain-containing protein
VSLAVGLLDLANSYCEQQLKKRCERIIKQGISVDNVAMLYATAIKYQVSTPLRQGCKVPGT